MSQERNLQEAREKIEQYYEMDYIDDGGDIENILTIAEHALARAIRAEDLLTKEREANNPKPEELLNKLEGYEQRAYAGGYGTDWLTDIGEGFKLYVEDCVNNKAQVTLSGFIQWVDNMA